MSAPTLESLRFRAGLLYSLTPATERDFLFALMFQGGHQLDGDRLLFSDPGLGLVACLSRYGYSVTLQSALDAQTMRQQERDLLADLALLNQALEQQGDARRYALSLGQLLPHIQGGRADQKGRSAPAFKHEM